MDADQRAILMPVPACNKPPCFQRLTFSIGCAAFGLAQVPHMCPSTRSGCKTVSNYWLGPEPRQSQGGESRQGRKAAALSRFRDVLRTSGPSYFDPFYSFFLIVFSQWPTKC